MSIDSFGAGSKVILADFNKYNSPIAQSSLWGMSHLYDWQSAVLASCWKRGAQVAVRTCNESGKSGVLIPLLSASFASAFHGSQIVITSASERQLKKQMEPNLKNFFLSLDGWKVTANEIESPAIDGFPPSRITWFSTRSGELFEGFHIKHLPKDGVLYEQPLLIIIDEAKSVKHDIFVAVERCNPTVQLVISTTGEDSGDFYDACMNKNGLWTTKEMWNKKELEFKIPWTMCPHLMKGHSLERKKAMIQAQGYNDPEVASILMAEFFRGGTYMVFEDYDMTAIKDAMDGITRHVRGEKRAFCDFSGGGDEMTLGVRDGNRIYPIEAWRPRNDESPDSIASRYIDLFKRHSLQPNEIDADNGGLGLMIINEIHSKGWSINRIQPNTTPIYKAGFADAYAEMHWKFKEMIHKGNLILPKDDILLEQCRLRRYTKQNTDENKIRIESKHSARSGRGEKSPDRLDTVVHLVRDMVVRDTKVYKKDPTKCPTIDEYWKMLQNSTGSKDDTSTMMDEW